MKRFVQLYLELDRTTRTSEKVAALRDYFQHAPPEDSAWAAYLLTGRKIGRGVSSTQLRRWASEKSGVAGWLLEECYHVVGDLSETLSLILPEPHDHDTQPPALHALIRDYLSPLAHLDEARQKDLILRAWGWMNASERLVFHKLLSANFRIGVSRLLVVRALAETAGVEPAVIAHRIAGHWSPTSQDMQRILAPAGNEANTNPALPFPFMLAHALHEPLSALGSVNDWFLEWKWDGIRAQIIRRGGRAILWSRGDEMVGGAFPELVQAACALPDGTVLDGEIVAWDDVAARPLPFAMLQRRLNRKNVEIGFWPEVPVIFIAFDLLEHDSRDVRSLPLEQRKAALQSLAICHAQQGLLRLSENVEAESWTTAESLVDESRQRSVEGLMLKRLTSSYQPGRPTGLWWKLKVQPYTVDAVLIAAQPGHGKRAGLLTDYTFGVWDESQLVPIAKAYSGLTDAEITEVDRFVRNNTLGRYGPVRAVAPLRVFELGFEAIQRSDRHKSGIALRFPRMLRMRSDKKPSDADNIQTLRNLLAECEARG